MPLKPKVEDIEDLTNGKLVDVNDYPMNDKKPQQVAKCIANGAKPKASVFWEFDNQFSPNQGKVTIIFVFFSYKSFLCTLIFRFTHRRYARIRTTDRAPVGNKFYSSNYSRTNVPQNKSDLCCQVAG